MKKIMAMLLFTAALQASDAAKKLCTFSAKICDLTSGGFTECRISALPDTLVPAAVLPELNACYKASFSLGSFDVQARNRGNRYTVDLSKSLVASLYEQQKSGERFIDAYEIRVSFSKQQLEQARKVLKKSKEEAKGKPAEAELAARPTTLAAYAQA